SLDAQRDSELIFVSLQQAQKLFGRGRSVTAVAVDTKQEIQKELQQAVGNRFVVKNIYQQNEIEYKLVRSEKVAIYLIILLVMIVASLTLIGTVLMLIIEKRENSVSLRMLGMTVGDIRKIFIYLGLLVSFIGAVSGLIIGLGVSLAQQVWGFVPIRGASLLLDSYPVKVIFSDAVLVTLTVILITFIISWSSCRFSIKN
ncbi:MAG: FtsX-like permease family protein, partial [Rikenellaceae bacterium]